MIYNVIKAAFIACILSTSLKSQEVFSLSPYARPDLAPSYQLGFEAPARRFSYISTGENRIEKGKRTFRLAMGNIPRELGQLVTFPFRDPQTTGLFLLGAATLMSVDRQTTTYWQDHVEPVFGGIHLPQLIKLRNISAESQLLIATVGLTYVGGVAFNDERAQTAALLSTKAVAYSYVATQLIIKPLFGRLRPVDGLSTFVGDPGDFTTNPWDFGYGGGSIPWTGGAYATSFASFHFTQYFAMARIYSGVYDNNFWPYLAAGVISAANIRGHNHWVSDMVAGAVIGTGIGNLILNNYEARRDAQNSLFIIPSVTRNSIGISMAMEF